MLAWIRYETAGKLGLLGRRLLGRHSGKYDVMAGESVHSKMDGFVAAGQSEKAHWRSDFYNAVDGRGVKEMDLRF